MSCKQVARQVPDRLPEHLGGDLLVGGKPGDSGMTKGQANLDVCKVKVSDEDG